MLDIHDTSCDISSPVGTVLRRHHRHKPPLSAPWRHSIIVDSWFCGATGVLLLCGDVTLVYWVIWQKNHMQTHMFW